MNDEDKTKAQLIGELVTLRQQVAEIETSEALREHTAEKREHASLSLISAIDAFPHPFTVVNLDDYSILVANAAAKQESWPADFCYEMSHQQKRPCDGKKWECPIDHVKRTGEPLVVEHVHYQRDGTPRNVEVYAYPVFDKEKRVVWMIRCCLDITERKRAEEALQRAHVELEKRVKERTAELRQANEQLECEIKQRKQSVNELKETSTVLHTLIHAIPDLVYFKDAKGNNIMVNRAFEKSVGLTQTEIVGKTDEQLFAPDLARQCRRSDKKTIKNGKPLRFEEQTSGEDGNDKFFDTIKVPLFDEQGNPVGLVGVSRDITDKKRFEQNLRESERYFRSVLSNLHEDILVIDRNYQVTDANRDFLITSGRKKEELVGHACYEVFHGSHEPCDKHGEDCGFRNVFETGKSCIKRHEHIKPDGSKILVELLYSPLKDEEGTVTHLIEAAHDVTHEAELEVQLRQAQKMEAVGILAGGIAHDFNNLLQAIQGYAELLLLGKDKKEPGYWELQEIARAGKKGGELTQQLLIYSRKLKSDLRPSDLNHQVERVRKLLERTIPKNDHNRVASSWKFVGGKSRFQPDRTNPFEPCDQCE